MSPAILELADIISSREGSNHTTTYYNTLLPAPATKAEYPPISLCEIEGRAATHASRVSKGQLPFQKCVALNDPQGSRCVEKFMGNVLIGPRIRGRVPFSNAFLQLVACRTISGFPIRNADVVKYTRSDLLILQTISFSISDT